MILTPTVLILGAGASVHCGYPLGRALVKELCEPVPQRTAVDEMQVGRWSIPDVEEFVQTLSYWDPSSIDAFLEENTGQSALGKFLIARQLKKRESMAKLFPPNDA